MFITIEGIDGSGKSTQARMLADWLRTLGREVVLTREPGGTPLGEKLRALLLDGNVRVEATTELFLYAADRAQHVAEVIRPAIQRGQTVVCERYVDSTAAYQGYGRGLDLEVVHNLNRSATGGVEPDLTLLLDLPVKLARERLVGTPDRLEREAADFHERVAAGYRELSGQNAGRTRVIDAASTPDSVFAEVVVVVRPLLGG